MIYDNIKNAKNYFLDDDFRYALDFLKTANNLAVGRHELCGGMFVNVSEFTSKPEAECRIEAHYKYIDLQYIAYGVETMGYSLDYEEVVEDLSPQSDAYFVKAKLNYVTLKAGDFAIFFTNDYHMPAIGDGGKIKKIVVKIPVRK